MATGVYEITGPDGGTYEIEGDESEVMKVIQSFGQPPEPEEPKLRMPGYKAFGEGVISGVTALPRTIYDLVTSPAQTGKGIIAAHKGKAEEALAELEKLKALKHKPGDDLTTRLQTIGSFLNTAKRATLAGVGAAVPIVGPGMAEMAKGVTEGDPRSVGEAAGSLATGPLLKGAGRVMSRVKPAAAAVAKGRPAVELTPLQRGETGMLAQTEAALRQAVPSANLFSKFDEAQVGQLQAVADDMVTKIGQKSGLTSEQFGKEWKTAQKQLAKTAKDEVAAEYDTYLKPEIAKAGLSGFVNTKLFKAVAKKVRKQIEAPAGVDRDGLAKSMKKYEQLPNEVSFEVMMDIRKRLQERLGNLPQKFQPYSKGKGSTPYEGALLEAAETAMGNAAKKGKFKASWELAEARKAEFEATWRSSTMKSLSKAKPSEVAGVIESMTPEDLKLAKTLMDKDTMNAAGAHIIEKWLTGATEGKGTRLSGAKLEAGLGKHGLDRLEILLGKKRLSEVQKFTELVKKTQPGSQAGVTGRRIGSALNTSLVLGTQYGLVTLNPAILGSQAGAALAMRAMARAMLKQNGSGSALARMVNAMGTGSTKLSKAGKARLQIPALALAKILQRELEEDPELQEAAPGPGL